MPETQEDILRAIAAIFQQQNQQSMPNPAMPVGGDGSSRADFLADLNKYTHVAPHWLQQPFLGTTPTLDLAGHLTSVFAQQYFTGAADAAQVQDWARLARDLFQLPAPFVEGVLRTIGHTVNIGPSNEYLVPQPIREGFRPFDMREIEPTDVPQG